MTLFKDCFGDLSQESQLRIATQIAVINKIIGFDKQSIAQVMAV